ncbi:MAG: ferredoxin-type protein NapF [Marinomonas sp.]
MQINHSRRALFLKPFTVAEHASEHSYLPLRPPWSLVDSDFLDQCSRCHICIDTCEENIIKVGDAGYPELDFSKGECSFCEACLKTCEGQFKQGLLDGNLCKSSPAIVKKVGLAPFYFDLKIDDTCLSKHKIACQSCQEVCESEAISMKWLSSIPVPELALDDCTGCGACLSICPSNSFMMSALASPNMLGHS